MISIYTTTQITVNDINVQPTTTIKELKEMINPHLLTLNDSQIKFIFNDGQELDPIVWKSNSYDNIDFKAQTKLLDGAKIYITGQPKVKLSVYMLLQEEHDILYASTDQSKVLKYFVDNHIRDTGFETIDEMMTELYGVDQPFDYDNSVHTKDLKDAIAEAHYFFMETKLQ